MVECSDTGVSSNHFVFGAGQYRSYVVDSRVYKFYADFYWNFVFVFSHPHFSRANLART